jgi:subtilisin family serine protease
MSWTIERTAQNEADISALESEIKIAVGRGILLFCTANDQGNQKDKSYPANCDSNKLFRIGAATASGEKWEWVGAGQTDFIFPGEKVLIQPRHGSLLTNCQTVSGSSLATALASGLAALILYLVEVDDHRNLALMRNHSRMMEAFRTKSSESGNYILVWDLFKINSGDLIDEMDNVKDVVNRLNLKQLKQLV